MSNLSIIRGLRNENLLLQQRLEQTKRERDIALERERFKIKVIQFSAEWTDDSARLLEHVKKINDDDDDLRIDQKWSQLEQIIEDRIIELNLANSLLKENIDSLNDHMKTDFKMRQIKEAIQKMIEQENKMKKSLQEHQDLLQEINGQIEEKLEVILPNYGETDLEIIQENWKKLINTPIFPNQNLKYQIEQWKNLAINLSQHQQDLESCDCKKY